MDVKIGECRSGKFIFKNPEPGSIGWKKEAVIVAFTPVLPEHGEPWEASRIKLPPLFWEQMNLTLFCSYIRRHCVFCIVYNDTSYDRCWCRYACVYCQINTMLPFLENQAYSSPQNTRLYPISWERYLLCKSSRKY